MFICDDGMQLLNEEDLAIRKVRLLLFWSLN